jgi:PAS domain S-box-containing protein
VRRDGSLLWVEVHSNPLHHDDGVLYGAVASYDDVTARVENDLSTFCPLLKL